MNTTDKVTRKHEVFEILIAEINTNGIASIREFYNLESLDDLTGSVSEIDIIQPIVVEKKKGGGYDLIIGSRRIKASQRAGKETIPAFVLEELDDKTKLILALSENIHHEDLTPFEEARVMLKLLNEHGMTIKQLGMSIGRKEQIISKRIKLLKLPQSIQNLISEQAINVSTIKIIEQLKTTEEQERFAKITVDHALNAQELAALVRHEKKSGKERRIRLKKPVTSKKIQLKIYYITSTVKRLVENIALRMDNKGQRTVKKALLRLRAEIDRCVEKLEA